MSVLQSPPVQIEAFTTKTPKETLHAYYQENGFIILENALSAPEVDTLCRETALICRGEYGEIRSRRDLPGIIKAKANATDDEVIRKYLCVHFPHKICKEMYQVLSHPSLVHGLTAAIGPNVKCMQSMLFIKPPGKPGQAWHQDENYIPTRDRSLAGAWIAFDDATIENGCLWVIPGSHKPGILWPMRAHYSGNFDCANEAYGYQYTDEDAVPVELKKGSVVIFNGYLLHRSLPNNTQDRYRRALVNHYMSAESLLPWGKEVVSDNRDIVMVAGRDPYAYKGLEDRNQPHLRPDGEGGCGNQQHNSKQ